MPLLKNKLFPSALFICFLSGCSTLSDFCPFGNDKEETVYVTVYPKPVVVDLDYQNIKGAQNQVIIKEEYQHALTIAGAVKPVDYPLTQPALTTNQDSVTPLHEIVHFAFNKSALSESEKYKLSEFIERVGLKDLDHIQVEGHTDAKGTRAYNDSLSIRRAKTVRDYLMFLGVDGHKISVEGMGETAPVASNRTASQRAVNRRAIITPTKKFNP